MLTVLIALYMSAPERGPANARDPEAILTSLLLFPMPEPPIMRVAWTLQHEMLFYLVFVLSILNFRAGAFIFGLWMVGCGAAAASGWKAYPFDFLLSAYNLLFLFGMGAAVLWRRLSVGQARLLFWLGLSLFLFTGLSEAYGLVDWTKAVRTLSFGAGAAAIAAALAGGALAPPRWLTFLGDASYSIYLLHLPAMLVLSSVLAKFGAPWNVPPILSLIVLTTFSAVAGCWVHVFIEKPVLARLSSVRRVDARPGQQA